MKGAWVAQRRQLVSWLVLAMPPAAWAAQGLLGWFIAASACAPEPGLSMGAARLLVGMVSLAALAATVAASAIAARQWRTATGRGVVLERERFVAVSTILVSTSLTLGVILAGLPVLFIQDCGFVR